MLFFKQRKNLQKSQFISPHWIYSKNVFQLFFLKNPLAGMAWCFPVPVSQTVELGIYYFWAGSLSTQPGMILSVVPSTVTALMGWSVLEHLLSDVTLAEVPRIGDKVRHVTHYCRVLGGQAFALTRSFRFFLQRLTHKWELSCSAFHTLYLLVSYASFGTAASNLPRLQLGRKPVTYLQNTRGEPFVPVSEASLQN